MKLVARLRAVSAGLQREIIRDTAASMLFIRIVEGLAAWILYNEVYLADSEAPWLVPTALVSYLLLNLALAYRYRTGDVRLAWVAVDLIGNLLPIAVLVHLTGGVASPLVMVFVIKMGGFAFVYGLDVGIISMVATVLLLAVSSVLSLTGMWHVSPPAFLDVDESFHVGTRLALLALLIVGAFQLFGRIRGQGTQLRAETERARAAADRAEAAAEREGNSAAIAGAMMVVSDAVSRVIRLDEVLKTVVEVLPRVLDIDYCGVFSWDELRSRYQGSAIAGVDDSTRDGFLRVTLTPEQAKGDLEWVRHLAQCAVVPALPLAPLGADTSMPSLLLAPLHSSGHFFGVLFFARRHSSASFTERDITVADGVAAQVAVALERTVLIEDARRMVQALDSTGECVVITDELANVVYVNPSFLRTLGFGEEDVMGRDALTMLPDLSPLWVSEVVAAAGRNGWRGEALLPRHDGTNIPALLDINLIRDDKGEMRGAVAIFEDISERRRMEEQLHRTDRLATAGEMAAGIAHEVNNALVGLLSHAGKAREETDPEKTRQAIDRVEAQANRIADIVQGLLGFARPRTPERQPVGVRALIDETLELQRYDLDRAGVVAEVDVAEGVPPVWVDPKQMQQVLVNIVANARQAMAEGGGRIELAARREGRDVLLSVHDTGPGIPPELLARVFDPFVTTKASGTGLGLSVSYGIVRAHGGDITVESPPGEGTTFVLRLPVAMEAHRERALVIDDDEEVGAILAEMLEGEGLEVDRVLTGLAALERLNGALLYDVVFLDVRLPDLDGPEVYERLAGANPAQAQRVIFVTGGLWRNERGGLRQALGSQPVLPKPCTSAQVRQALQELRHQVAS
jgi:PAS domain S-box-containing protein